MGAIKKTFAAITGVGGFVPPDVMTNDDLAKIVDTNDEWITTRTGIKERRILRTPGWATSDMGTAMVRQLLEKTNTDPSEIDLIICATITPDMRFPDTANLIADNIGAKNAWGFDLTAACSGFLFALNTGAKFIESGTHKKVVVVGVDFMSTILDYTDRTTCIIFGDGGACVMLEPNEEGLGVQDAVLRGDGSGRAYLNMRGGGSAMPLSQEVLDNRLHFIYQEGKAVFRYAVTGMTTTMKTLLDRNHLSKEDLDWVVPHQANKRIISSVADYAGVPMEKVMVNIEKYGNTTAGTIPLCLWDYESKLRKGDNIVLTAFGGGFTWGSVYLKWAYDGDKIGK